MAVEIVTVPNNRRKLIYENYIYVEQKELKVVKSPRSACFEGMISHARPRFKHWTVFIKDQQTYTRAHYLVTQRRWLYLEYERECFRKPTLQMIERMRLSEQVHKLCPTTLRHIYPLFKL